MVKSRFLDVRFAILLFLRSHLFRVMKTWSSHTEWRFDNRKIVQSQNTFNAQNVLVALPPCYRNQINRLAAPIQPLPLLRTTSLDYRSPPSPPNSTEGNGHPEFFSRYLLVIWKNDEKPGETNDSEILDRSRELLHGGECYGGKVTWELYRLVTIV